jgi:hypothetical protein
MKRVAAFLTRYGVFAGLAYIQSLMASISPVILRLETRLLLSSCQIAIFAGMLCVYLMCRWIFSIMHSSRLYNVTMQRDSFGESGSIIDAGMGFDLHEERERDFSMQRPPNVHTETASQVSRGLIAQQVVIFPNRDALGSHIMRIYGVGFLLWATVYCFNYTLGYIFFHTSTGFVLGHILRIFLEQSSLIPTFYCSILALLTCITYIQLAVQENDRGQWMRMDAKDILVGVFTPIVIGFSWASGLLFGSKNTFCLSMATEAFPVCLLCVMPIMWATPVDSFEHIFLFFEIDMYLLSILVEPTVKFLAIYTMLVSLQTGNTIDMVIVITSVAHGQMFVDLDWNKSTTPLLIIQVILTSLLLVLRLMQYCYTDVFHMTHRRNKGGQEAMDIESSVVGVTPTGSYVDNLESWRERVAQDEDGPLP